MSDNRFNKDLTRKLVDTILELQTLRSLESFGLGGGTNQARRFNHRRSVDIDLFSDKIVGIKGLTLIKSELEQRYNRSLIHGEIIDPEAGEQYCFLRAFINKDEDFTVKVEVIQNIALLDPVETIDKIRMLTQKDIGLLKLMSASNRKARKDIYDLDFLTDRISLEDLLVTLKEKHSRFSGETYKCLFDLDDQQSPADDVALLLAFDQTDYSALPRRPNHSNDIIDILPSNKAWISARSSWRKKVIAYMRSRGMNPPAVQPVN